MTDLTIEELYEIPIEKLNLPVKALNSCLRTGLTSVGDCVDCAERLLSPLMGSVRWNDVDIFRNEVSPALIEQGYWKPKLTPYAFAPEIIEELKQKLSEKGYWTE